MGLIIPQNYKLKLLPETTEIAIKQIKDFFEAHLAEALNLRRVTAPLFVMKGSGLNDELSGVELPVEFCAKNGEFMVEIVQSLAKWKRVKLADYELTPGFGLYADMNAIRPDESLDNLHSLYVDQWDWEKVITADERNSDYLKETVKKIYRVILDAEAMVQARFPHIASTLPREVAFVHAQELLDQMPGIDARERERRFVAEHGAAFIIGIGGALSDGNAHDSRAADYDDWSSIDPVTGLKGLNGDLLVWNNVLDCPMELSSMGIRVDPEALSRQLAIAGQGERANQAYHRQLLDDGLPLSIGGGIGQSRLCMLLLQKAHIGEVQASVWPDEHISELRKHRITLL